MSETEQKETEFISGVIEGIIQKATDKWQVAVKPDGSQYTKNLWTKDSELVTALQAKIGSQGAFVCGVSHWTNNEGKPVRSLWINEVGDAASSVATPAAAPKLATSQPEGMTPEKWDAKDSAIHKMACIKTAADALKHTIPSDPSNQDLVNFIERAKTLSREWHLQVEAVRKGDDRDVPFLSEHDQNIPFG